MKNRIRFWKLSLVSLLLIFTACKGNFEKNKDQSSDDKGTEALHSKKSEFILTDLPSETDSILLRVAFLGDGEPKPLAEFPGMAAAVEQINTMAQTLPLDFVIGIGDIAHKGTEIQYEAATEVLQKLEVPFYPIMGNEEHGSTIERYMLYAQKWNSSLEKPSYVLNHEKLAFVLASPDHGRDLDDSSALWILEQVQRLAPKPVILLVHAAQQGVYPENPDKGISNQLFVEKVISQPNLAVVISGDLHMDMDRVVHSKKIDHIHYLHIPALERTKIPDETNHTPMFRVMTVFKDGEVIVDTYEAGVSNPRLEHTYSFSITLNE
jgi:3',5'-cyclic-AMP phosphodiesterase